MPTQANEEDEDEQFPEEIKKKILIACLIALTIGNMMILNVVSFLPTYIEQTTWTSDDGFTPNSTDISIILAAFSIAQIIFAPFNGTIKNYLGSKNTIIIGFTMLTATTFGLGLMALITDPYMFIPVACVLRFFQGQGDILLQITCYSVVTSIYSSDMMRYIGYIEICVGLGLGLGPSIGSFVYGYLGYAGTMYLFAGLNGFATVLCVFLIPNALNQTISEDIMAELEFEEEL